MNESEKLVRNPVQAKTNEEVNPEVNPEQLLKELYYKLGKAYYEGAFEDPLPQLLPLFDQITKMRSIKKQINKAQRYCHKCGEALASSDRFCMNCGQKIV